MEWIFLSPHFDDVAFSCGGLVWEIVQSGGNAQIWTICGGEPLPGEFSPFAQEHHVRWESGEQAVVQRRQEDQAACRRLGAAYHHFPIPDCIYRRAGEDYFQELHTPAARLPQASGRSEHLYATLEAIFGPLRAEEDGLVQQVSAELARNLPESCELVCPLTFGGHTDHRLTRRAVETLNYRRGSLWYYADFPYVLKTTNEMEQLKGSGWRSTLFPISPAGVQAWYEAIAAHHSQISTFWEGLPALRRSLESYLEQNGGVTLWQAAAR